MNWKNLPALVRARDARLIGSAGVLVAVVIAIWPMDSGSGPETAPPETYSGPAHTVLQTSRRTVKAAFRFGEAGAEPEATVVQAVAPTLVGIAGNNVYLKSAATGQVQRATVGGESDGWTVSAIRARSVTLRKGGVTSELVLFHQSMGPADVNPAGE